MGTLDPLRRQLTQQNQRALAKMHLGDSAQIRQEISLIQNWLGSDVSAGRSGTSNITIEQALSIFFERKQLQGVRQIRLVCYGCTQSFGQLSVRVIENRDYFSRLLTQVARYQKRKRALRKFYRGLLNSYFSYNPYSLTISLTGRENWARLRQFLADHLALIKGGASPDWLNILQANPNLLQENPGEPYIHFALQGDWMPFNTIRERLEIPSESWLVREMVLSPIQAVVAMPDEEFKHALSSILLLLHTHPLYLNEGLSLVLDRYHKCKNNQYNHILTEFTIGQWGNPWLAENRQQWPCRPASKAMLAHWLKRYLLGEFFTRLCGEETARSRRLQFWTLYSEDLTGLYFAHSATLFESTDKALFKFRQMAKGLLAKLGEDRTDIQICILQFSHFHVVEFNTEATPAYFYDTRLGTPPFYFGKGWVEIGALNVAKIRLGATISSQSQALSHQDSEQRWEERFARTLGASETAIQALCRQYHCHYEDARHRTGLQWIHLGDTVLPFYAEAVLTGWGFAREGNSRRYCCRG